MLKVVHHTSVSNENAAGGSLLDEIVRDGARAMLAAPPRRRRPDRLRRRPASPRSLTPHWTAPTTAPTASTPPTDSNQAPPAAYTPPSPARGPGRGVVRHTGA